MDSSPAISLNELTAALERIERGPVYCVRAEVLARHGLPRAAARVAELCDGTRPAQEVLREAGVAGRRGEAVLRKLVALGVICPACGASLSGFSAADEAFFASEVQCVEEDAPSPSVGRRLWRRLLGRRS